jgi:hypothetical protein
LPSAEDGSTDHLYRSFPGGNHCQGGEQTERGPLSVDFNASEQALAISSDAHDDPDTLDVVKCTGAVVFMGTPHRGSEDMAATGEKGRMIASALLVDSSSSVLDSLGLENADLERCHDKFTQLWEKYEFRVKTFQEGQALLGVKLGPLNEKVC